MFRFVHLCKTCQRSNKREVNQEYKIFGTFCVLSVCNKNKPACFVETLFLMPHVQTLERLQPMLGQSLSAQKVLCFLSAKGASSIAEGNPYVAKWKGCQGNVMARYVPCPRIIARNYFARLNKVNTHNQYVRRSLHLRSTGLHTMVSSASTPLLLE